MKNLFFVFAMVIGAGAVASPSASAQAAAPSNSPSSAIVSVQSSQCFDVVNYSTVEGAIIQMYPCTGTTNQMWVFQVYSWNTYAPLARIVNVNSGLCASAESSVPNNGVIGLNQRVCNVNDSLQQWAFDPNYIQAPINTGAGTVYVNSVAANRHVRNVGTNWCLRTADGFGRPYLTADCGTVTDNNFRFKVSGI